MIMKLGNMFLIARPGDCWNDDDCPSNYECRFFKCEWTLKAVEEAHPFEKVCIGDHCNTDPDFGLTDKQIKRGVISNGSS